MKICPFCAEEIKKEAIKCKHCGEFLNKPEENKRPKEEEGPKDDKLSVAEYGNCQDCGAPLAGISYFCDSCGVLQCGDHVIMAADKVDSYCQDCGAPLAGTSYFCDSCGIMQCNTNIIMTSAGVASAGDKGLTQKIKVLCFILFVFISAIFINKVIEVSERRSTTSSLTSLSDNSSNSSSHSDNCYSLGFHYGKCATQVLKGQQCNPNDDIVLPENCQGKDETVRGIAAGSKSVY